MVMAKTIINYKDPAQPVFIVEHLEQVWFDLGFRILNPEFRTTSTKLVEERIRITEYIRDEPSIPENYIPNYRQTPRQREERRNPGLDRSTRPEIH